jgi:hypothetical protein
MRPEKQAKLRGAAGAAVIAALVVLAYYLFRLAPVQNNASTDQEEKFPPIYPSANPALVADQYKMRDITRVARTIEPDGRRLLAEYDALPPFHVPDDPHLTRQDVDRYIKAYDDAAKEIEHFRRDTVGKKPGIFGVFALAGMIEGFYQLATLRSQVANKMTNEEFDWLKKEIMLAALYCVQYNLDQEKPSAPDHDRLIALRDQLYLATGIREIQEDFSIVPHMERLHLDQVPRSNIALFLDNYHRINYIKIHFDRPTPIIFDKQAILAAAAHNPP